MDFNFENARRVWINKSRWNVQIGIIDEKGDEHTLIASADSGLTYGDGIWFGTAEEFDEDIEARY